MVLKIKTISLAIFAALALGALPASAAEFHSEQLHTEIKGSAHAGEDVATFNAGTWRCNEVTYSGTTTTATASTITVVPTYSKCTAFGFVGAVWHINGCGYQFQTEAGTVNPVTGSGAGKTAIECPAGAALTLTVPGVCEVKIGAQGPIAGITYTNTGAHSGTGRDLTLDMNMTGIVYTQVNKGFCANGTFANGTYKGSATVQGRNTLGNAVGIWLH